MKYFVILIGLMFVPYSLSMQQGGNSDNPDKSVRWSYADQLGKNKIVITQRQSAGKIVAYELSGTHQSSEAGGACEFHGSYDPSTKKISGYCTNARGENANVNGEAEGNGLHLTIGNATEVYVSKPQPGATKHNAASSPATQNPWSSGKKTAN